MSDEKELDDLEKLRRKIKKRIKTDWKKIDQQVKDYRRKRKFRKFVGDLKEKKKQGKISAKELRDKKEEWIEKHERS
ncbi:hypothetical protein AKJ52_02515 [candidate division MSBL1 archaeon SCGC-AAA382C18]|uniref:Uncharacterized protein n=1 Tax=candidate division MSBL1 archaeon SCGC-AAA382C18 TaxID=1698281 RepID=A0A133VI52_9EURY|nr:hypothetical protein AKJ52_02515 [candidate division MSBL1 archaeon SCGC-AAA382C18]